MGIGLRLPHRELLANNRVPVGFVEVIAENYIGASELPLIGLDAVAAHYPLVGHGVALNLLGAEPLDLDHLRRLRALIQRHRMPYFSDHLCWSASGGHRHHDLLPAPYHPELIPYAAARARFVQEFLGVPFGIENLSAYVGWSQDQLPEWEFYRQIVEESGTWYMVDVNNIYVSSVNCGFDPRRYLASIRWDRVLQVHIAGHLIRPDGLRHDTHDQRVAPEVWALYREAWAMGGPFPTLLEWDEHIPPLEVLLEELAIAKNVRAT